MNHYPTDLVPVYFCTKQIALENVTQWFVTPINDSPTGINENIPPWNWTVDDNFELAHDPSPTPPPIVPPPLTAEE
ncbi:hypothetical protein DAEQUDRAFT_770392 [Daedalea quercina L-15889]|uniref:Uncharacterized protein n=1 Tax=Daedalea quercina L-15889 TaxID=1314783 RepID=A0A165KWE4_9APHY|nr:hypothetical protein DAEQUDRAFT_770392 [Daedalea quercina L-15889]